MDAIEIKEEDDVAGSSEQTKNKSNLLVKCPMYCRINCANKHHPLLVTLLNCKDTNDEHEMHRRLQELQHVVDRYESTGKWSKDDPIPDSIESYRYPMVHWAAALGFINALKWLLRHGMCADSVAEKFGKETSIQKALLCLQETSPTDCYEKFEQIVSLLESSLWVTDSVGSTVLHTCAEYMANDIPKFQYFQHCLFSIIFALRTQGNDSGLRYLMELQNLDGNTCLHILCRSDKCGLVVRSILRETMAQNPLVTVMRNSQEQRPIDVAKQWGCPRIFRYLTKLARSECSGLDSEDEELKLYQQCSSTPTNIVYDRKGNIIGEKLQTQAQLTNTVYDRRGNIIGEKIELKSKNDPRDKVIVNASVTAPNVEKIDKEPDVIEEPAEKKFKLEQESETNEDAKKRIVLENAIVIHGSTSADVVQKSKPVKKRTTVEKVIETTPDTELPGLKIQRGASNIPFISQLKSCILYKKKWKPSFYAYTPMGDEDHDLVHELLSKGDQSLRRDVLANLKADHASLSNKLAVVQKTEQDLNLKYESLQDGQMKMVVEVQKLLHKLNRLKREEKSLTDALYVINTETNTTHTTHQGLRERLQHCKAALNVLCDIYEDENDSDN